MNLFWKRNLYYLRLWLAISVILISVTSMPHNSRALNQIDTKYYTIIYDQNGEYTAGEIAKFCDEIYEQLMARYDAFTDNPRVMCIVNDAVDMANGYAIYYQNTITIYATNMDFELRGQSNWLKNVFVHEMTHMIALKKAAKGPINYLALGIGRYNRNPDVQAMTILYHLSQPAWFSEGTAQVGAETFGAERWDTHRDMVLRSAWYEHTLLSLDDMTVLSGQKEMEAEMVYNQGYSLVQYIRDKYGYDKVVELNNECGLFDFNPTVHKVLGVTYRELYNDWIKILDARYAVFRNRNFDEGKLVVDKGSMDYFPVVSPDGRYLAWLSNRGKDYAMMDLMLKDLSTGKTRVLVKEVDYRISWSHDSKKLLYVKRPPLRPNFYDIYSYTINSEKEDRISRQMRARDPSFSPGDSLVVFIRNEGGNNAVAIINTNGTNLRYLTSTHDGTQFYKPSFSPDGSKIVFGIYRQNLDRDIGIIDAEVTSYRYNWDISDSTKGYSDSTSFAKKSNFRILVGSVNDERDPWFLPDGSGIVYTSDRTGVFNIYMLDFNTKRVVRLTDVCGGAFCPSVSGDGMIHYAGYKTGNFSIYRTFLKNELEKTELAMVERNYLTQPKQFDIKEHFNISPFTKKRIVNAILPVINIGPSFIGSRFGLNVFNVGVESYISDLLGQDAFIAAGSVGRNLKEDTPLNTNIELFYQRKMVPITSSTYTHSPTLYMGASRWVINNYINRFEGEADSVYFADMSNYGLDNVLHDLYQDMSIADIYRHEFRYYNIGVQLPLAPRHSLAFETSFRQYYETLNRNSEYQDHSKFYMGGLDITDEITGAGEKSVYETRFFNDLEYFRSGEFSVNYSYYTIEPESDSDISPKGTAIMARMRHMLTEHADSLVEQVKLYVPLGMYSDGSFAISSYVPDEFLDEYRPYKKRIDINEYILYVQRNQGLPYLRHVLNGIVFMGYKDISLKDVYKGEGSGYNWPLKYYLGGAYILSGYPYFSFWGTKMFYSRFNYVFPIRHKIGKNIIGVHFQRLYGSAFFEAGKTWNFSRLSMDNLKKGSFKRDAGFELRLKMIGFYRLPIYLTASIVWPLDDLDKSPYREQRDARRYYFGLQM